MCIYIYIYIYIYMQNIPEIQRTCEMLYNVVQLNIPKYLSVPIHHAARPYSVCFQHCFGDKTFLKLPKSG